APMWRGPVGEQAPRCRAGPGGPRSTLAGLPGLRARRRRSESSDPDPRVDGDTAVRLRDDGVEVELGDLREVLRELRQSQQEVGERGAVGGGLAAEPGDETPGLASCD